MDSSTGFFEFIFSESPKDFRAAYESLNSKPYQIFDILLKEECFMNFFSRMEIYGKNLAYLLSQFPNFEKYDYRSLLSREMIRAFALSFLAETFDDTKSRSAAARIVVSVVKLSDPTALGQLGMRLGALPEILQTLIVEGHIKNLALSHRECFEGLISEPQASDKWVDLILDLCGRCQVHGLWPDVELSKFIRTVPCEFCIFVTFSDRGPNQDPGGESTRPQDYTFRSNMESNVFKYLLGEPLGPWKIILSQQAMEDLEEVNTQGNLEDVHLKLSQLASGDWGGKKIVHRAKWGNSLSYPVPPFKAFYKTGYFILWQIDIAFDERFGEDYQVIKVWAIGKPQNLDRIGIQIHQTQQIYTSARVGACNREELDGEIRYPVRVRLEDEETGVTEVEDTGYEDFDDSAQLAKFYSLTTTLLDNIASKARNVAYPVVISGEEASVVDHFLTPAFILGRSGTGKTTCLVYKLVGRYLNSMENRKPSRQVLLTRSKRLASKLRVNTGGLIEAKLGERKRPAEGSHAKNDDFDDITKKEFLSLTDMDFPLVCTFDYLLRLIENSIWKQESRGKFMKIDNSKCTRVINFVIFNIEYWQPLPSRLKKGIPVDSAFLEIMGVIKGSVLSSGKYEPLSRQEYLGKRWRIAPNFAWEQERDTVYDLYEWYERAKKKRGDIDQVDRIIKVCRALEAFGSSEIFGERACIRGLLNEIYVDEVQDQRTPDIGMLLSLVRFPQSIHFAGDTAQCISKDALFRFADAKSLFYEHFKDSTSINRDLKPTLLPLSHNFRSHKQILSVASLIMDLLYRGFPELVDELPPEIGDIPGPKPTLYIGSNITNILKLEEKREKSQKPDADNSRFNEYGEVRVILVRDEETRDGLRAVLGKSSLVLTILQSKGMEFEDVFLYNFLSTSPYSHKLRILEEVFERAYHKDWERENIVLCSELKHLYVGVTRARHRLWILESNTRILDPVRHLFNETATLLRPDRYPGPILNILTEKDIGVSELHKLLSTGSTVTAAQWREMGYQMIDDVKYSEALYYFEQAKDLHGIALANAYIAEETGLTNRARGLPELAKSNFIKAAELFSQARSIAKAVQCRKEGGDPKGAVKVLADNGAYEDAAWLAADFGLFSETSEIYTKLKKHEKALAGYARVGRFKWMFNYIKKFKSEIEPYCRKQYVRFGFLKEFGESDSVPDELEKRALDLIGSPEERKMFLSRFDLMNKLFEYLAATGKCTEAYEVGVSSGILGGSFRLLCDKILPQDPNWGQGAELNVVCMFLQAEYLAKNPRPRTRVDRRIHKNLQAAVSKGNPQINAFVKMWKDINKALDIFYRRKVSGEIGNLGDMQIASYVDILVTKSVYPDNKFKLPIDHIMRVLEDLRTLSSHGKIPSAVQFYCGIYETPRQPGEYIFLEWSPFSANSKPGLPLRPVDIGASLRDKILRYILRDIVPPLVSLDKGLRVSWDRRARSGLATPLRQAAIHFENLELLARLCQIFSNASAMIKDDGGYKDSLPQNWDWRFWKMAFLEQTGFRSAYEHSLDVLFNIRSDLVNRDGKYHALCSVMTKNDTTEYRITSAIQMGVGGCVSSLLAQYQTSLFLGYGERWRQAFIAMRVRIWGRGIPGLRYGSEMVTLVNQFVSETKAGDFPGRFCENIYKILGALERAKAPLNFYSPSVISLYEELALSLIFLVRPYEFLTPQSWYRLYSNRWERKHRSPSVPERFQYQQCLVDVCLSFCEMVINIERRRTQEIPLRRRSVTLIVVCLINLGTFFPRPKEYVKLWLKSQEVFRCSGLDTRGIQGLPERELIGRLARVFREYGGNDSICLVWGFQGRVESFVGVPLEDNGISVVNCHPIGERKRHLRKIFKDQGWMELNAAWILAAFWKRNGPGFLRRMKERRQRYAAWILTAFWKRNGPEFLRKMKERRRQLKAACILTAFWRRNGLGFLRKMKIRRQRYAAWILTAFWKRKGPEFLQKMKERRQRYAAWLLTAFWKRNGPMFLRKMKERRQRYAAWILTAFWKRNGPRFVEKMKERRRYLAPRYKYPRNCCLLVGVCGEDKSWMR